MSFGRLCSFSVVKLFLRISNSTDLILRPLGTNATAEQAICQSQVQSVPNTKREYLENLLLQQPLSSPDARVLKVAVIGCPNSGKSSLVNMLTKWKVCAVSGKAHTTRSKQTATYFQDNVQLAFVDLPGLVGRSKASRFKLEKTFIRDPHSAIFDSDLILVVIDVSHKESREVLHEEIVKALHFFNDKESVLVLNKVNKIFPHDSDHIDSMLETLKQQLLLQTASPEEVCNRRNRWLEITKSTKGVTKWLGFSEVFMVSSFIGDGIDKLRDFLVSKAIPTRSWILPPTMITDQEPTELIRMCVWSHCLNKLQQEIPYSLHIIVDDCDKIKLDSGDDRVYIHVRIRCKNERQLLRVLGMKGNTIKEISSAVKLELMTMFRCNTVVKLTAELFKIDSNIKKKLRRTQDFSEVFPQIGVNSRKKHHD
ncbi:GTP-binding protein era, putative [Schistosoma mansoni]|uniref:GTP-binding protein era, putative n=1 Tax=Schistosoma mansoni TaxID=6183 RepID=UPI00022C84E0|nr:GTP-binding protein era, putative [Schistosoma mansoni]|eukprot:XP_018645021.1 GTP-binding protein era, putative [Schistosoma mansoni]